MYRILSAAATNDLTTLATVKHELAISDGDSPSPHDERLTELISTASDIVAQFCNRDTFGRQTIEQTEYLRQPTQGIVLAFDINPAITSVTLNDVELSPTEYVLDGSILRQPIPVWPSNSCWSGWHGGKIVIVYDAGFILPPGGSPPSDLPRAIERACMDIVFSFWGSSTRDQTVRSETVDGVGSIAYATSGASALPIAPDRLMALDRYKRFGGF